MQKSFRVDAYRRRTAKDTNNGARANRPAMTKTTENFLELHRHAVAAASVFILGHPFRRDVPMAYCRPYGDSDKFCALVVAPLVWVLDDILFCRPGTTDARRLSLADIC